MKKTYLFFLLAAASMSGVAAEMGELPLGEQITVNQGDTYTYNPTQDGVLRIEFEGSYPENGIVMSDLYNSSINPFMEFIIYTPFSDYNWQGYTSPALYEIKVNQPAASGVDAKVKYEIVGPIDKPSITLTATFEEAGTIDAVEITSLSQTPNEVFDFNQSGTLVFNISPLVSDLTCGSLAYELYSNGDLVKTVNGANIETVFHMSGGSYIINLTNLRDYELIGNDIDAFTIIMSDFNYNMAGEYVNDKGQVVLPYLFDEFYGMITLESNSGWPNFIYPYGANPATTTLTFSGDIDAKSGGEVILLGTYLENLGQEAPGNTNVYEVEYTVEGNKVIIDFENFTQIGPINDRNEIVTTDGYRTSGSSMTLTVVNFLGTDGSQVQPLFEHINWQAENTTEDPGTTKVESLTENSVNTVYNLQGIMISQSATSEMINELPKGLYIINGKKIWKK